MSLQKATSRASIFPSHPVPERCRDGVCSSRLANQPRSHAHTILLVILSILAGTPVLRAQSLPTASRMGDLQVGGGFVFAHSGYNFNPIKLIGASGYATFDWHENWGIEADFHHSRATTDTTIYERTYEIGPRIFLHHGAVSPYAKLMYGRGVYNFHNDIANVAYNLYTYGAGADFHVARWLNVRGDYELQNWAGFPLGTLHPSVVTIGLAYHFNASRSPRFPR
ncbi:MAG TPA: outer membrane beta-barrel protein [Acidobacteriaceae bacterium]|nr:outer membrane beta-barrel protein [Acidobacteriaceae bacterium]